jgi:hypothetical protein
MEAAAAADAGSATSPKRRVRGDRLKPLPASGLEKARVVPRRKDEGNAQAKSMVKAPAAPTQALVKATIWNIIPHKLSLSPPVSLYGIPKDYYRAIGG